MDDKIHDELTKIRKTMADNHSALLVEIAKLKVKSGIWGFAAGAIPTMMMIVVLFARKWM